jgi:hypothetical protein
MSDDIVKRLRERRNALCDEAADVIARLWGLNTGEFQSWIKRNFNVGSRQSVRVYEFCAHN